jgi:hypothetical protein
VKGRQVDARGPAWARKLTVRIEGPEGEKGGRRDWWAGGGKVEVVR